MTIIIDISKTDPTMRLKKHKIWTKRPVLMRVFLPTELTTIGEKRAPKKLQKPDLIIIC